jgi:translation initiation factor 3 subunit H
MDAKGKDPVKNVEISAQVVLKILQHCTEALPQLVTGQLLGLDVGQTLEVTDCFAFPVSHDKAAAPQYPQVDCVQQQS